MDEKQVEVTKKFGIFSTEEKSKPGLLVILSLGEIVKPNQMAGLQQFVLKMFGAITQENIEKCASVLGQLMSALEEFKLGKLEENAFVEKALEIIHANMKENNIDKPEEQFKKKDFYEAWNAMNPTFSKFGDTLKNISTAHTGKEFFVYLVSHTNSIDMKHLWEELEGNKISFEQKDGNLAAINGVPLLLSYVEKADKAAMIKKIIKENPAEQIVVLVGKNLNPVSQTQQVYAAEVKAINNAVVNYRNVEVKETGDLMADLTKLQQEAKKKQENPEESEKEQIKFGT